MTERRYKYNGKFWDALKAGWRSRCREPGGTGVSCGVLVP
jgi:hypothetical protein